jgi:hypothetical protein
MNMTTQYSHRTFFLLACLAFLLGMQPATVRAQFTVDGEFRTRWYSDRFGDALDKRGQENYIRYMGRIRAKAAIGTQASFFTEFITLTDNPVAPVRNIAGTGAMRYGVSEIYAEITGMNFLVFDVARLRVGRQQFPIGNGLSLGESYNPDKFDGARLEVARGLFTLGLFGAITGQNLSSSGLYPDPGSDQMYVARLGVNFVKQDLMAYAISHRLRGEFNDSYILGGGSSGSFLVDKLEYFGEFAYQKFNTAPGLQTRSGIGYMAGLGYQWTWWVFRSMKFETRYAAYQGDDASTPDKIEQFSPLHASFFWGARTGYVSGDIGGDFPNKTLNREGSRIWYSRFYVVPRALPRLRLQVQFVHVSEYVNNDGINFMDDEFAFRAYYTISNQVQLQGRYSLVWPNDGDRDLDASGGISSSEDRLTVRSLMMEIQVRF